MDTIALASTSDLLAARLQMALTLGFHIILACLGVGLPVLLLFAEWRYLRTGDKEWKALAKRWSKCFTLLFAVGAVSGTVLSFELGMLWPKFMGTFGSVIGLPFTLEAFAFFIEAIFAGIYLYSWDRLSPKLHWLSGFPIAIGGLASAWFVVTANAWMNTPQGFVMKEGRIISAYPIQAMFNPATWAQTIHMIVAAYLVTGFLVACVYAWPILKGRGKPWHKKAMMLGLVTGAALAPVQIFVGHETAHVVAATQPVKFAAMEGQFKTESGAPLRIGGIPDEKEGVTKFAVEIPGGLSWLAYGDKDAVVKGLNDFKDKPPVAIVHIAFQIMVGNGMFFLLISICTVWSLLRSRKIPEGKLFLRMLVLAGPLSVLALECGWIVTEVGRQPWIVQGIMKTQDAVTSAPGVPIILAGTLVIYGLLSAATIFILKTISKISLEV